jgi:hypothetical protein
MTDRSLSRAFSSRSILEICSYLLLLRWCSGANTLQACGSRAGLATFFYLFQIFFAQLCSSVYKNLLIEAFGFGV